MFYSFTTMRQRVVFLSFTLLIAAAAQGRQFFAALNGTTTASGSFSQPWALDTALRMPTSRVTGGDTIWIRGGVYVGSWTVRVRGLAAVPVVVQAYPGERVIFDSYTGLNNSTNTLIVEGNYCWLVNLEISNSSPTRISNASSIGTATDLHQSSGVNLFGIGNKLINCEIHDVPGTGVGYWSTAVDAEVYGCVVYNNGFTALDRGHGPNFYMQNDDGTRPKAVRNSFVFGGFSIGMQLYATNDKLRGFIIDSCTIFNSGALTRPTQARRRNIVAGGETSGRNNQTPGAPRVDRLFVHNNVLYRDTTDNTAQQFWHFLTFRENTELGFQNQQLSDIYLSFVGNHLYGDPMPLLMHQWDSGVFRRNFLYTYAANAAANRNIIELAAGAAPFTNWDENVYHNNQPAYNIPFNEISFASWKSTYGIDANSTYTNGHPTSNFLFVRPNKYREGSFNVTVMNYQQLDSVVLPAQFNQFAGYRYSIFDVQTSVKAPIMKGTLSSGQQLRLPLNRTAVAATVGTVPAPPRHTSKTMGTFIISFYAPMHTVKAGSWSDPTVWNLERVPTHLDDVQINHTVTLTGLGWCRSIQAGTAQVQLQAGSYLLVSNEGN